MKSLNQFIVRRLRPPHEKQLDGDIAWVCNSLGFMGPRDQDRTAFLIVKALILAAGEGKGLTSEELTSRVEPTQGAVIYHLKKLMKAGLVVKLGNGYELRMNSFLHTIEEIEKEIHMTLDEVKKIAGDIDGGIGLDRR